MDSTKQTKTFLFLITETLFHGYREIEAVNAIFVYLKKYIFISEFEFLQQLIL